MKKLNPFGRKALFTLFVLNIFSFQAFAWERWTTKKAECKFNNQVLMGDLGISGTFKLDIKAGKVLSDQNRTRTRSVEISIEGTFHTAFGDKIKLNEKLIGKQTEINNRWPAEDYSYISVGPSTKLNSETLNLTELHLNLLMPPQVESNTTLRFNAPVVRFGERSSAPANCKFL